MALVIKDRVKETTTTTGTGTLSLGGAASGFQSFVTAIGNGNTTYYAIEDANGTAWEVGIGTISATPDTLTRTTLIASSTGAKIELTSGTHTVFGTYSGSKAVYLDASGGLSHTVDLTSEVTGTLPVGNGGTGLTSIATLLNSNVTPTTLSLVIGTNVQAYDADLTALAGLSSADSNFIVGSASGWVAESGATARTSLGVDAAGTDNSTDVTLVTTSHNYLSISTQAITLGTIDISDDTNLAAGTGITLTGDTLSTTDSEIVHDNLSGFVANEHIDWTTDQGSTNIHAGNYTDTNTQLSTEQVQDIAGPLVATGGTKTLITVTYDDTNGDMDFVVDNDLSNYSNSSSGFITASSTSTLTNKSGNISQWTNDSGYITATLTDEQVQDKAGAMFSGNTETLITATYQDSDGTIDLVVDNNLANYDNSSSGFLTSHGLTFGIADTNAVKIDGSGSAAGEYAKFTSSGIVGEEVADVKTDLSLNNVENTALSTWAGTGNITTLGTISTGVWNGTAIAHAYIGDDAIDGDNIADDAVDSEHIADGAVDLAHLSATGTKSSSTYLRGDNTWATVSGGGGSGDMTGVDLTAGTGISIDSETNTTSGDYSATITCTVTDTNTQLTQEQVEDFVGGMLDGDETFITVTYDDTDGNIDFTVPVKDEDDMTSNSATHLATQQSIKAYVDTEITDLIGGAPGALDTLNELAAAINDDASYASTITTALGNKQAVDAGLTSIAALTTAANKMIYTTGSDTYAVTDLTAAARGLLDDADVATMRTTLGVDAAGTDNSTNVTLVTSSHDYLSISTQAITLEAIDLAADVTGTLPVANGGTGATALDDITSANTLLTVTAGADTIIGGDVTLTVNQANIDHDALTNFVANEHIDWTSSSAGTIHSSNYSNTQLSTGEVQDIVGGMVSGNTETGIAVTYEDGDGTLDFVIGTLNQDTTGTAAKVTVSDSTANTAFPVAFHDESNALLDDTGTFTYNPSSGTVAATSFAGADATFTSTTSYHPVITIDNTNNDSVSGMIKFIKDSADPAVNDFIGTMAYVADNSAGEAYTYAQMIARSTGVTDGDELGGFYWLVSANGSLTTGMSIVGAATTGDVTVDITTHDGSAGGLMLGGVLVTATATELNYVDGVSSAIQTQIDGKSPTAGHSSIATVGTITTGIWQATDVAVAHGGTGASSAADARTNLGVDAAGTDNSTAVTLAGSLDYITISGQEITRNAIDLAADVTGELPASAVQDKFLRNDGSDTTTGTVTAGGFTTTGTWTFDTSAGGTTGITNINVGSAFTDDDVTLMSAGAIKEKIEAYGYTTNAGDMTGVDLTAGTGITIDSETNTTSGNYSATITCTVTDTNTTYTAGTLLDLSSTTFNVDLSEASAAVMAAADEFIFLDNDDSSAAKRESLSDLLDTVAGTVGTTGLYRSGATLVVSDLHPVGVDGSANQLLTDDGDGTVTSEANLTFDGSTLTTNSGIVRKVATKVDTNYTMTASDHIVLVDTTGDDRTITLPSASASNIGQEYTIKKIDSGAGMVNIVPATTSGYGPDDIDQYDTKYVLYTQHDSITFVCGPGDATAADEQWWITSEKATPHQITIRNSNAQSIATGGWRHVEFQDTDAGSVGCTFSTSTDKITIARKGRYLVSVKLGIASADNRGHWLGVAKNQTDTTIDATDILPELYAMESGGETTSYNSAAATVTLAVGDTLNLLAYAEATSSTVVSEERTETTMTVTEIV